MSPGDPCLDIEEPQITPYARIGDECREKGRYKRRRIIHTAINIACIVSCVLLLISGLSMARHSLPITLLPMGAARNIHMLAAYWGFIAISVHAGLHMATLAGKAGRNAAGKACMLTVIAEGVCSFISERIYSYLLLIDEFVFFDFTVPLPVLIVKYIFIMCLFMLAGAAISSKVG